MMIKLLNNNNVSLLNFPIKLSRSSSEIKIGIEKILTKLSFQIIPDVAAVAYCNYNTNVNELSRQVKA